jgi:hypothetical protein
LYRRYKAEKFLDRQVGSAQSCSNQLRSLGFFVSSKTEPLMRCVVVS